MKKLLASLTVLLAAGAVQAADLLDDVKQRGTLRIAVEGTYPPFNYKDEQGKLTGFDVESRRRSPPSSASSPSSRPPNGAASSPGCQAGKYDVIVNQVAATDKRRETFDFSEPYVVSSAAAHRAREREAPAGDRRPT